MPRSMSSRHHRKGKIVFGSADGGMARDVQRTLNANGIPTKQVRIHSMYVNLKDTKAVAVPADRYSDARKLVKKDYGSDKWEYADVWPYPEQEDQYEPEFTQADMTRARRRK
jgi:hypothetical protein